MNSLKEIERVTISFSSKTEKDLYDFCYKNSTKIGKKFATFIKDVLREKMTQGNETIESIIDKRIEQYFKNKDVKIEEKAVSKYDDEDKAALFKMMNRKR